MHSRYLLSTAALLTLHLLPTSATPQAPSPSCPGIQVLNACIASTTAIAQSCAGTDYNCLCQKYGDVLTCYNECPSDPRMAAVQSEKIAYCSDAAVYISSSTRASITMSISSTTSSTVITSSLLTSTSSLTTPPSATTLPIPPQTNPPASPISSSSAASKTTRDPKASTTVGAAATGTSSTSSSSSSSPSSETKSDGGQRRFGVGVAGIGGVVLGFAVGVLGVTL